VNGFADQICLAIELTLLLFRGCAEVIDRTAALLVVYGKTTGSEVRVQLEVTLNPSTATARERSPCVPTLFANAFQTGILFRVNLLAESIRLSLIDANESLRVFRFQTFPLWTTHPFLIDVETVGVVFRRSEVVRTLDVCASDGRLGTVADPSRVTEAALFARVVDRHYFSILINLSFKFTAIDIIVFFGTIKVFWTRLTTEEFALHFSTTPLLVMN